MSKGDVVTSPHGERIVLDDVGQRVLTDTARVRVWDVGLAPGDSQPWHLHHNPYVVLNIAASPCRMDWLDGSEPRHLNEYVGGAVLRPTSPVHMLTNVGGTTYRNRLIELKDLGENRPDGSPADIGPGDRTVAGQRPAIADPGDGRLPVMHNEHVAVWEVEVPPGGNTLKLADRPHVTVAFSPAELADDPTGGTGVRPGGLTQVDNATGAAQRFFLVELRYDVS